MDKGFFIRRLIPWIIILITISISVIDCGNQPSSTAVKTVPHEGDFGIYELDLSTLDLRLLYSTQDDIFTSSLRLNNAGDKFIFAQKAGGTSDSHYEIFSMNIDGSDLIRLTNNDFLDIYPAWSPQGDSIAFLSRRDRDLDIYKMNSDGSDAHKLFDSGDNDADIDWAGNSIVFTSEFAIWKIDANGANPVMITDFNGRGEWGKANLPKGDYDPRLKRDSTRIVFERLEDTERLHGGYNLFAINSDGTGETRLTENYYSQGLASWSHSGKKIAYVVSAIEGAGKYDIYVMNSDGTENQNITPGYFPLDFLCYAPVFSRDDTKIFFIGQWWQ